MDPGVRPPAVAGMFYPAAAAALAAEVTVLLQGAVCPALTIADPKALIVPHAGYIYSGPTAACAYRGLASRAKVIRRVILLGPCHRIAVRGLAVPSVSAFATPLGQLELDRAAIETILALPQVVVHDGTHAQEHSLEVHLPFLQTVLEDFTLVPLAVGAASAIEVADVLEQLWGGTETLIVISSDLSHFHPYHEAQAIDQATVADILGLRLLHDHDQACGATPINGLLLAAQRHGLQPTLLDLRNSGDTAGDKQRVVGYASIAFSETGHDRH